MKYNLYSLTLMLMVSLNAFSEPKQKEPLQIWTLGLPNYDRQFIMDKIAEKYGFEFFSVGGCEVTKDILDNVRSHNDEVKASLATKHGEDWWDRFQKEVNEVINARFQAEKLVRNQESVVRKMKELNDQQKILQFITEEKGNGKFLVRVLGLENNEETVYFSYLVDIKTNKIELVDDGLIV